MLQPGVTGRADTPHCVLMLESCPPHSAPRTRPNLMPTHRYIHLATNNASAEKGAHLGSLMCSSRNAQSRRYSCTHSPSVDSFPFTARLYTGSNVPPPTRTHCTQKYRQLWIAADLRLRPVTRSAAVWKSNSACDHCSTSAATGKVPVANLERVPAETKCTVVLVCAR